jgi:hypothetical protein
MSTDVVTERNFKDVFPEPVRDRYWEQVRLVAVTIFNMPNDEARRAVNGYRASLENDTVPVREQILAYHEGSLWVAAELAGVSDVTPEMLKRYAQLIEPTIPEVRGLPD